MNKDIHRLRLTLSEKRLSGLIDNVQKSIDNGPAVDAYCIEELEKFKKQAEYMRMYAFAEKKDPYRQQVFDDMVSGLLRLSRDVLKCTRVELSAAMRSMKKHSPESDFDLPSIKKNLENYVSSVAMSQITDEDESLIIEKHFNYIQHLFDYIVTGRLWNESKRKFFSDMLSSTVIDTIDAEVIVSAITISTLLVSDELKIETLIDVYTSTANTDIKGRALVGWVLGLHAVGGMCDRLNDRVSKLVKQEEVMHELLELQMQIFYCSEAENDVNKINKDIMPGIVHGREIRMDHFGFPGFNDDDIDNIEENEETERAMDEIEENIGKIVEMEKKGSDVYFGGFAKMKKYSFFSSMVNWFYPYFEKHPNLVSVSEDLKGTHVMTMVDKCPFCNSDKYSLALSMSEVYRHMPAEMKMLINSDEFSEMMPDRDYTESSCKRRMYLQDLYRFFKLNSNSEYIYDPFTEQNGIMRGFFFDDYFLFCEEMIPAKQLLARFIVKKHPEGEELALLLDSYESDDESDKLLRAGFLLRQADNAGISKALDIYKKVYVVSPQRNGALQGIIRCLSHLGRYDEACKYCEELIMLHPESENNQLNYAIILIKCNRLTDANKILFKLHYENPKNRNVMRVLAWCLLMEDKTEKSVEMYEKILKDGNITPEDNLNVGFAKWVSCKEREAADYFAKYAKSENLHKLTHEIDDEREFLNKHDIVDADMCMMLDLVEELTKQS